MTNSTPSTLPPIERSVLVSWDPQTAFRRFTADFATWWPSSTHSIGGKRVNRIVFECKVGGRIYEELTDGRRFQWGTVTQWREPHAVGFTWHPSRDAHEAQDVEVRFTGEGAGTRVVLVSSGWERLGARGARERKGYSLGWGGVLSVFAGRPNALTYLFAAISHSITLFLRVTGRLEGEIEKAGGRMTA